MEKTATTTQQTAAAAVRALGFNQTRLRMLARQKGALARTAREILPQVQAITPVGRRGRPVTFKVVQNAFHYTMNPRGNGHHKPKPKRPVTVRQALQAFTALTPTPMLPFEGDTIDKALNDMLSAMQRVEGFVKQAQLAQAWITKMRRELPEVAS